MFTAPTAKNNEEEDEGETGEGHEEGEDKTEGTNSLSWRNAETDSQTDRGQRRNRQDKTGLRRVNV